MMDTTTTTKFVATTRARNSAAILTNRHCEKRATKRLKIYDRKCPGLYVSVTPAGVATFSFKFTDRTTGKQRTGWLGVYNPRLSRSRMPAAGSTHSGALALQRSPRPSAIRKCGRRSGAKR
jgi:hypothetical protein